MSDVIYVRPVSDQPIGGGANLHNIRRNYHLAAIGRYRNAQARLNPGNASCANGEGMFDALAAEIVMGQDASCHVFADAEMRLTGPSARRPRGR
ncbi:MULTISPECIES: hypothetical protein [Streptomyces]|uniref:hypothetical protein n=1 Tax=Streptomyces TaxID=1883 RepID=UPI00345B7826